MTGTSSSVCVRGTHFTIEFLRLPDRSEPAREFLESIGKGDRQFRQRMRLQAQFKVLADTRPGSFRNRETFKELEDGIFEFKAHQLRIFCFYRPGGRLILASGVVKKKDKHNSADLARAKSMRDDFVAREIDDNRRSR